MGTRAGPRTERSTRTFRLEGNWNTGTNVPGTFHGTFRGTRAGRDDPVPVLSGTPSLDGGGPDAGDRVPVSVLQPQDPCGGVIRGRLPSRSGGGGGREAVARRRRSERVAYDVHADGPGGGSGSGRA